MRLLTTIILSVGILLSAESNFRGKSKADIMGQGIPMAFQSLVQADYGLARSDINPMRGSFMIIIPDAWETYISTFVSFKASQGFDVIVKKLSDAGSSADDIKTTISNRLDEDPLLEYVLLIGEVNEGSGSIIPTFYYGDANDVTDQKYSHILGDDFIPDIFVGRMSVTSVTELMVVTQKTIKYHRDPLAINSDWLNKALVVAGNYSNSIPVPTTPKWTSYWLRDELLDNGYASVDTVYYPPTQQGASLISASIDAGVGIVNYRGWGDANGWHYPEFHVSDVAELNNGWMTPVFTSFVCNANDFGNPTVPTCFGESLIRAGTPTNPRGGVAVIGPSDLHTSTKFNNVINAYMFDAMLDGGVTELAPAMLAGQLGLLTEFPHLDGPGEGQEFYFHVYNILGDPSLSVHLATPDEFSIEADSVWSSDGFVSMTVTNSGGNPIRDAVIAVMADDSLIAKGITNSGGQFQVSVNPGDAAALDIYANKNGFIQGHNEVTIHESGQSIEFVGYVLHDNGNGMLDPGEKVAVFPILRNTSDIMIQGGTGAVSSSSNIDLIDSTFTYSDISEGSEVTASDSIVIQHLGSGHVIISVQLENEEGDLMIRMSNPIVEIDIEPSSSQNSDFTTSLIPALTLYNFSSASFDSLNVRLISLSDSITISGWAIEEPPFALSAWDTAYVDLNHLSLNFGGASSGSELSLAALLTHHDYIIDSIRIDFSVDPPDSTHPIVPSEYGYWSYDDIDSGYTQTPEYNWIELDPAHGGSGGTAYVLDDDDHIRIDLPFAFQYFGNSYDQITISSNGWTSFETTPVDYFWNFSIPMAMGPNAMLAPFWDDLETIDTDGDDAIDVWINVFTRYDETEGRFIIEWSRALNGYDEATEETFEIILYSQSSMPTTSGDGVIEFQYYNIDNVDVTKNYSTVGIESPDKNDGLQITFNNTYTSGAAELDSGRVIRFTTEAPENYVPSLSVENEIIPIGFQLHPVFPNPFNPSTTIRFNIPITVGARHVSPLQLRIFDITGRLVETLVDEKMKPGTHEIIWNANRQSTGMYFVELRSGSFRQTQKMILLK